jgi:hypothetical protein
MYTKNHDLTGEYTIIVYYTYYYIAGPRSSTNGQSELHFPRTSNSIIKFI